MSGRNMNLKNAPIEFETYRQKVELILSEQLDFIRRRLSPTHHSFEISNAAHVSPETLMNTFSGCIPDAGEQVIYVFRLLSQINDETQLQEFIQQHQKMKASKPDGHSRIAGINKSNIPFQKKRLGDLILYVGTSKHFGSRIKEHLGYGSLDTACLGLRFWPFFLQSGSRCTIDIYSFGSSVQAESIKLMEHELSDDLKPLIGRNRKA